MKSMSFPATFIRDAVICQEWLELKKGGELMDVCVRIVQDPIPVLITKPTDSITDIMIQLQ